MSLWDRLLEWLTDPANWTGSNGIPNRLSEHIAISAMSIAIAVLVAVPPALWLGHLRKGGNFAVAVVNIGRAIPSFAIVVVAFALLLPVGLGLTFWPTLIAMVALALPPIFTNTYTGIVEVDPGVVESARGMGMKGGQLVGRIEMPLASPLILTAVRVAAVQVVATATLGAVVGWGGLGRYIIDGFAFGVSIPGSNGDVLVIVGAVLVALLAVVTEGFFGLLRRIVMPRTVSQRAGTAGSPG